MAAIKDFRELRVYQQALETAMAIFELTGQFPKEEKYSLVDQMRRSSRCVCANLAEAWRKRRYPAAFISKLSDAESEGAETQVWLDFALRCGYLDADRYRSLNECYDHLLAQLSQMSSHPEQWGLRSEGRKVKSD